jgi:hypothetical protein
MPYGLGALGVVQGRAHDSLATAGVTHQADAAQVQPPLQGLQRTRACVGAPQQPQMREYEIAAGLSAGVGVRA